MVKTMMMVSVFPQQQGKRRRAKNNSGSDNDNNSKYIAQQDFIFSLGRSSGWLGR